MALAKYPNQIKSGKIITIPISHYVEGMIAIDNVSNELVVVVDATRDKQNRVKVRFNNGNSYDYNPSSLLELVVEFSEKCVTCNGDGEIEDNGPKVCGSCGGNGTVDRQLPIFKDQWAKLLKRKMLNLDTISFEIINDSISPKLNCVSEPIPDTVAFITLVEPQYTEEDVKKYAFYAVQWAFRPENQNRYVGKSEVDKYLDTELN